MSPSTEDHCLASRGSFTSDDQEFSSYPYVFNNNCPDGVTDADVSRRYKLEGRCNPVQPAFQNQYTLHSHFQDLFRRADCPSCPSDTGNQIMPNNTCIDIDGTPCGVEVGSFPVGAAPVAAAAEAAGAAVGAAAAAATGAAEAATAAAASVGATGGYAIPLFILALILLFLGFRA